MQDGLIWQLRDYSELHKCRFSFFSGSTQRNVYRALSWPQSVRKCNGVGGALIQNFWAQGQDVQLQQLGQWFYNVGMH